MIIGLDVGWSPTRKTCGLAVSGSKLPVEGGVVYGDVTAVALNIADVPGALKRLIGEARERGERVLLVTDAIVGVSGPPTAARGVDNGCSRGTFFKRAQSYPATQPSGQLLASTLEKVLAAIGPSTRWFGGGPLPKDGVIVTETNPTTAMAVALAVTSTEDLPTRKSHRSRADGSKIRAKSDWYWYTGASAIAATELGHAAVGKELHHERVAALWCLALASRLEKSESGAGTAAVVGDASGTYLFGSVHADWVADVTRVGVQWGSLDGVTGGAPAAAPIVERDEVVDLGSLDDDAYDEEERGTDVMVVMTDTGGLTLKSNPWLASAAFPFELRLMGRTSIDVTLTPFDTAQGQHQFKMSPSVASVLKAWDIPPPNKKERSYQVRGEERASASAGGLPVSEAASS